MASASNDEVARRVKELLHDRPLTTGSPMSLFALAGLGQSNGSSKSGSPNVVGWLLHAFAGSNSADVAKSTTETTQPGLPKKQLPSPVEVRNASDFSDRFKELSEDLNLILALLTGIGMTIAVLSIVNTMLMSVTERVIEFGILKANGWSPWDVLKLITVESATLGLGGGVLGGLIGWTVTLVVNARWPDRVNLFASPGLLAFSVVFSTIVGLLGGLYPAVWAMRLSPMEAIRRG